MVVEFFGPPTRTTMTMMMMMMLMLNKNQKSTARNLAPSKDSKA